MRMDESGLKDRGRGSKDPDRFKIVPITPELLREQRNRASADAARQAQAPPPAPASYEYKIAPHDVLSVIVWEHPELTMPAGEFRSADSFGYRVSSDGFIFFPHVGTLQVADRTPDEVRRDLTARLAVYVRQPQLQVLVAAYRGKRAQIAGEVMAPAQVPITDVPLRVQDAIALAKGFTLDADPTHVTLTRGSEVHHLNLQALYEGGDTSQNWVLQDGDIVHVPDRSRSRVFVLGEVKKPATLVMPKGLRMTLADAFSGTEGLDPVFANPGQIFVFRGQYDVPEIYHLDASSPDALLLAVQFQLQPLDVIFVSTYQLGRFSRVVGQILPTVQALWETYTVIRYR
jgi:polysaccharide export outer membrane protein